MNETTHERGDATESDGIDATESDGADASESDGIDAATLRRRFETVGVALTAVLAAIAIGFVTLYWLRDVPGVDSAYELFLAGGRLLDVLLGTNVFQHAFMWQSIATGILVGIVAPLIGTYLVHREMALIGETLAHTAFAGVAIGLFLGATTEWGGSLLLAALVVAVAGALGVQWLAERTNTYGDVPIAIMLTGSFAVGTIIISYGRGLAAIDIDGYLFGSLAIVTPEGARLMTVLSVLVVAAVALTYKELLFITFDEQAARVARLDVTAYNALLIVMTAVVVVGSMQILGVILVAAMLVVPVAAASQLAASFRETQVLAVVLGQASIVGGFALSLHQNLPAGGSIVVVSIAIYLLAIGLSGRGITPLSMH